MERLDRFELIADIASGGMATVYLARLGGVGGFQRLYAIKRLHPHLASDREFVEMFLDEARLAARIHHPNVVPIHEVGTSERGYYLVMDYVEGDTLARLLMYAAQRGPKIPPGVAIRIVVDTLAGLHAAHELRDDAGTALEIVHRDVSPQNVLVGVDGIARITDFGVARAASRLSTTRTGQLKGKIAYMAPEQARATKSVDRRADVFAMGIVLWEALAQKRLFKGETDAETLNRLLYEPVPTLRSAAPTVPTSLDAIVMKALDREPDARFASAADFAEALESAASALDALGSSRDVAACMQAVMRTELEQQREAVRTWMTRSEPSASKPQPGHESLTRTRVDGPRASTPPPPPAVSSVSSMVHVPLPSPPSSEGVDELLAGGDIGRPAGARRARKKWSVAFAAMSLLALSAFLVWQSPLFPMAPIAPSSANPRPAAPLPQVEPQVSGPSESDAGRDAASATQLEPVEHPRPAHHLHHAPPPQPPPQAPSAQPAATPEPPAVPDDITRNPYR